MKVIQIAALAAILGSLACENVRAVDIVDATYSANTNIGDATQYFLEGGVAENTKTWTIQPGVTVSGGRFFIGSTVNGTTDTGACRNPRAPG
jgi:hypothetical protein